MLGNFLTAKKFIMKHLSISCKIQVSQRIVQLLEHVLLYRTAGLENASTCIVMTAKKKAFRNYADVDCSRMCVYY
jgi:hypothetical protein